VTAPIITVISGYVAESATTAAMAPAVPSIAACEGAMASRMTVVLAGELCVLLQLALRLPSAIQQPGQLELGYSMFLLG
jgi:hypothetical protein